MAIGGFTCAMKANATDSGTCWWVALHPLQVIDVVRCLNWHMLGAADLFEAAAGVRPGGMMRVLDRSTW